MSDARRRAEEALRYDHDHANSPEVRRRLRGAIEALLAAGPEGKAPGHDRIAELESLLRECNAVCLCGCPDSEHEADECGESCGHDNHECIRVAPAVLEIVQRYRVALSDALRAQPTPPPSDAVREAETPGTTRVEGHDEQATDTGRTEDEAKQRNVAGDGAPGQIPALLGVQPTDGAQADPSTGGVPSSVQILRSRAADGTVAPAGAEVREFIERVASGPCWASGNGRTECKDAFLPKGERLPREFCLRCHAVAVLPSLGPSDAVREAAEEAEITAAEKLTDALEARRRDPLSATRNADVAMRAEDLLAALSSARGAKGGE